MWHMVFLSGYAAEPPQGSVTPQAGEWTLTLESRMAANTFGLWFSITRGLNFFATVDDSNQTERAVI